MGRVFFNSGPFLFSAEPPPDISTNTNNIVAVLIPVVVIVVMLVTLMSFLGGISYGVTFVILCNIIHTVMAGTLGGDNIWQMVPSLYNCKLAGASEQ